MTLVFTRTARVARDSRAARFQRVRRRQASWRHRPGSAALSHEPRGGRERLQPLQGVRVLAHQPDQGGCLFVRPAAPLFPPLSVQGLTPSLNATPESGVGTIESLVLPHDSGHLSSLVGVAVDTNILICACDQADPRRQTIALDLITNSSDGVLLWQVACEFLAASRKLAKQGFTPTQAWNRLAEFQDLMPLVVPTAANLLRAKDFPLTRQTPLWDALILAACVDAGVDILYSEAHRLRRLRGHSHRQSVRMDFFSR